MTYDLIIGDRAYSSWSLRGWLLFDTFEIEHRLHHVTFAQQDDGWAALAPYSPARTVPTMITPEGVAVSDSLAIAEELATRHPDLGIWPSDPAARATARTMAAEMHSAFSALRDVCPMNLRAAYSDFDPGEDVRADLRRLEDIWTLALDRFGGPWLCGNWSAADIFFAPVAARIAGYGLAVSDQAQAYVDRHLARPAFRQWRAMGLVHGPDLPWYARDASQCAWPGPAPLAAVAIEAAGGAQSAENTHCPYSGKPVSSFLAIGGRVFGFCNDFCRDKTVADPLAWPDFARIYNS